MWLYLAKNQNSDRGCSAGGRDPNYHLGTTPYRLGNQITGANFATPRYDPRLTEPLLLARPITID
jgi:hypothetical protein